MCYTCIDPELSTFHFTNNSAPLWHSLHHSLVYLLLYKAPRKVYDDFKGKRRNKLNKNELVFSTKSGGFLLENNEILQTNKGNE
jgi:hypothetical protein